MITSEDIMRTKGEKVRKLENLAKACAEAKDDDMKKMWYDKLIELGKQYNMSDYVMRKLVH
tara:strand:+ start:777 stop:959 length:183 start_codon:yes stop_codon:yes gene_type:complete